MFLQLHCDAEMTHISFKLSQIEESVTHTHTHTHTNALELYWDCPGALHTRCTRQHTAHTFRLVSCVFVLGGTAMVMSSEKNA